MKPRGTSFSAQELADKLQASLHGDRTLRVTGLSPLESPVPNSATFVRSRTRASLLKHLAALPAMVALVDEALSPEEMKSLTCTVLTVSNSQKSFVDLISFFFEAETPSGSIHPSCVVDPSAVIGLRVSMGPGCVVGPRAHIGDDVQLDAHVVVYSDVRIGSRCKLFSGVVVRERCTIGADTTIHSNSVIGSDGFGYLSEPGVGIRKVPQVGTVEIGEHVEIGASTTIDRGAVNPTVIGSHTKIDNQVQIAHNVVIGSHCLICAQVGIAGSVTIGNGVVFGGSTGVADHVTIASGVRLGGRAGVISDLLEPGDYMGFPAQKADLFRRQVVMLSRMVRDRSPTGKT